MNDPEMAAILGDEDDLYWDDVDLVSSKWDDETVVSIDPYSSMSIGQLKAKILDFADEKEAEGSDEDESDGSGMDAFFSGDSGAPDFSDDEDDEEKEYEIDDLRNEIEDLTMEIEEYDEAIADAKREYEEAMEMGDDDEAEYARDMLDDMRAEKNGAIAKLKEKQSQLKDLGESARNIIPKGSLRRIQENWVKKNLL